MITELDAWKIVDMFNNASGGDNIEQLVDILDEILEEQKKKQLTADPVKHGHWTPIHKDDMGKTDAFECSVCNLVTQISYYTDRDSPYEYCPNCGTKMDEVTE